MWALAEKTTKLTERLQELKRRNLKVAKVHT